jgi:mannose-1-phosphate guanylyltransferase
MAPQFQEANCAAVILAGGEGSRLSSYTREIFGYHIPKQFCPLLDGKTLLGETLDRISLLIPRSQTLTVLNHAHERFYSRLVDGTSAGNCFIQPTNRGTAPAILGALLRLIESGHTGAVAIFPSDHYVTDDTKFMRHVSRALFAVDRSPQLIVLLGIAPDGPETEYGWIEPGAPVADTHPAFGQLTRIRSFWEKPSPAVACELYEQGYLWNSSIVVADAVVLLSLIAAAVPELYLAMTRFRSFFGLGTDDDVLGNVYRDLPVVDFSGSVLAAFPTELSVLPVVGVGWSDLGDPKRLLAVISSRGQRISVGRPTTATRLFPVTTGGQKRITRNI